MNDSKIIESAPEKSVVNTIGILFFNELDEVLIFQRNPGNIYYAEHYHLLSGKMDGNETPEETLMREAWEEAQIKEFDILEEYEPFDDHFGGKIYRVHLFKGYLPKDTKITLNGEHQGYEWVPVEEIEAYDLTPGLTLDLEVMGILEKPVS